MNLTVGRDEFEEALVKNLIIVGLAVIINCINGTIIMTFCRKAVFHTESRYILYMNLVVNDMIMVCSSVIMYVLTYAHPVFEASFCLILVVVGSTTTMNTPIILAGMAIERYIAICKPLHHTQICTVRRTYVLIGLTWGMGLIPALVDVVIVRAVRSAGFFSTAVFCYYIVIYNTRYHRQKAQVVQAMYMSFVWLSLIYTYLRIFLTAKAATDDSGSASKAQNTILLQCMLSYLPPLVDSFLLSYFPAYRTKITFLFFLLTNIVPRLLSPLIYGLRDKTFAKHMSRYYSCGRVCCSKGKRKRKKLSLGSSNKRVGSLKT
ncbi:odorant receptor 131-2-like [Engraulis encrasicolus]|uniref:odorant receptor 131-2-like n=1 Tax=Engraulis encrasicolus TaxID=184585 RepID=UPI002FCEEEA4